MLVVESEVQGDTKDLNKLSFSESVKKFINEFPLVGSGPLQSAAVPQLRSEKAI